MHNGHIWLMTSGTGQCEYRISNIAQISIEHCCYNMPFCCSSFVTIVSLNPQVFLLFFIGIHLYFD